MVPEPIVMPIMNLSAWHYATREPIEITWDANHILSVKPAATKPTSDLWIAPGLFDIQVNGYAGVDFQRDDITTDSLLWAARQLRADGCSRCLLTLITDQWPQLIRRLHHLKQLRDQHPELRQFIAGWHLEGPFLSSEPGFHGAHNPAFMLDPTPQAIDQLRQVTGSDPLLLTLAPERSGTTDAIGHAINLGIRVSLGHTNASTAQITAAIQAGATGFTHLGNACPQTLDRHDNILWRVLDSQGLTVSLIPDSIHVSPSFFRLVHRIVPHSRILYTTDAMAAAGAPPGRYSIGPLQLEVSADGVVRQPGKSNFAGSALRPIQGIQRAASMLNKSWQSVWDHYSSTPATFMGLTSPIEPGHSPDFCVVEASPNGKKTPGELAIRPTLAYP